MDKRMSDAEKVRRFERMQESHKRSMKRRQARIAILLEKVGAFNEKNPTNKIVATDEEVKAWLASH